MPTSAQIPDADPHGARVTILVVDDDVDVLRLIVTVLRAKGYAVLTAADGSDAMERASQHPGAIELLLTDVSMPRADGHVLAQWMRAERPETVIIFMSGDAKPRTRGFFLPKPFLPAELLLKVAEALRERQLQKGNVPPTLQPPVPFPS